jgi:hypothetical protein
VEWFHVPGSLQVEAVMVTTNYGSKAGGKRAKRRHHRARLKKARRFYWGLDLSQEPKLLAKLITTAKLCSCWICRNERRNGNLTIQERRFMQDTLHGDK